jgi:DNA-directed RNA polymerase II subunit RPB2
MANQNKQYNWEDKTWNVLDSYFSNKEVLVKHHTESYNHFINIELPNIIRENNPIIIYDSHGEKKLNEYHINFNNVYISKPVINENDGTTKPMYPYDARIRNLSYSGGIYVDIDQKVITKVDGKKVDTIYLPKLKRFNIGKIPIMLNSQYCILNDQSAKTKTEMGECEYDLGGYFIINGSEKVVICQERKAENKIFVFPPRKTISKYSHVAEVSCVAEDKPYNISLVQVKLRDKEDNFNGRTIKVQVRNVRQEIPLFVLFRALGVLPDKDIVEHIIYDIDNEGNKEMLELLRASIEEASPIQSKKIAIEYISKYTTSYQYYKGGESDEDKIAFTYSNLMKNLFVHVGISEKKKAYYLGLMVNKLLQNVLGKSQDDDRDSFINKRVETTGDLLAQLFRNNFAKMVKEMKSSIEKDFRSGRVENFEILGSTLSKKIKPTTIETGMKYALATGNWGIKNQEKKGIAQVLQRLTYLGTLSSLRRVVSPMQRGMKATAPRKLVNSQFGIICPAETPEGQNIGVVKNMSLMAHITIPSKTEPIVCCLEELGMCSLETIRPLDVSRYVKVFINGDWQGIHKEPSKLLEQLKNLRRNGIINIYTSFSWYIDLNELLIQSDGGRITRPMYIIEDNKYLITDKMADMMKEDKLKWDNLLHSQLTTDDLTDCSEKVVKKADSAVIEYVDQQEADTSMFAMTKGDIISNKKGNSSYYKFTHCEIHPSMMLGVLASNIPFPDHNQSPRNLFQGAMGKQAIGIYATNFRKRMDTLGHILHYPQKELVSTRASKYVNTHILPAGQNVIAAIACYTGYNQEDSLIINQSALDRGLFTSSFYRTHKDEEKKNQSTLEEERFCKPDRYYPNGELKTEKMKFGSYENIGEDGFIKENSKVNANDVIIGKVIPLKNVDNGPKYSDASTTMRQNETGVVDWVYDNKNGDGYRFCKVRVRSNRKPVHGDKFASKHGQKGTIGITYKQHDMPFTKEGIVPDIIISPHAIPSRMTVAQLIECVLGKTAVQLGIECDATPFSGTDPCKIGEILTKKCGLHSSGTEVMYNGKTGEQMKAYIFIGPTFYYRLKHLVEDKVHSRSTGPYQLLTRQPAEGRSRDGGLRIGEMERDCMLAHGTVQFLKERMFDNSDKYLTYVCQNCGFIAIANSQKNIYKCNYCDHSTGFSQVQIPYASKLLIQELMSMAITPRLFTDHM